MRFITYTLVSLLLFTTAQASIVATKHNLSVSNTLTQDVNGTAIIKATTEGEICVFCHIPHQSRDVGKPLWNRSMPTTDYILYDSDYLRRINYPAVATDLGVENDTPGALSRQCLSCHDGTVAVGAVFKLRRDYMNGSNIEMAAGSVDASGNIPEASSTSFGADLSNHHPVGIVYDPTAELPIASGSTVGFSDAVRGTELRTTLDPTAKVKLFEYASYSGKYVECSSCHDPHKDNTKFLHEDSSATHAVNVVNTCISCHNKTGWTDSVHQSATQTASRTYSDLGVLADYGTASISDLGCANCHTPHNAESTGYLNRKVQASTCYQGAASSVDGANCHGVGGAKDIESIVAKAYSHPVDDATTTEKHTNLDVLYGTGVAPDDALGIAWATNQHAVCMDCHNPHQAKQGTHITDGSWYGTPSVDGNRVSNALTGVTGVEPTWPGSEFEYQICLKCHSYWGVGSSLDGATSYTSKSGAILTDVAWEMNINNKSGHPVVFPQDNRAGSDTPRALLGEQMIAPWITGVGQQAIYCSDCHGNDTEVNGDPKGPHGSAQKYLLKGINQYWPLKPDGVTLYTMDDIAQDGTVDPALDDTGVMCKNCHDIRKPHTEWWNKMAGKGYQCVECHVVVPHGSPVSRLIGYYNFPEPYNYTDGAGISYLKLTGFRKDPTRTVDELDVWMDKGITGDNTCDGMTCHRTNDEVTNGGQAYDINPYP